MKFLIYILKYLKYNIPYKEYKLLFNNGNNEIGISIKYLRNKLNLNLLSLKEIEKIYIIYKLKLLKTYHYNNFKLEEKDTQELIKFLICEAKNKLTLFDAIEFHNYIIKMIPNAFPLFSRFIFNNNSNWIKLKLPFNNNETAYLVNSEKEIEKKFNNSFKNPYLKLRIDLVNTYFDNTKFKIFYEYNVIDQYNNILGKVYFYEYSKTFIN